MCGEHQLLQHPATTHGNTCVCFSSTKAFSLHPSSHRPLLCSPRRLHFGLMTRAVTVELREAEEQGCAVGSTVWPAVRREVRVLPLWVQ